VQRDKKIHRLLLLLLFISFLITPFKSFSQNEFTVNLPEIIVQHVPVKVELNFLSDTVPARVSILVNGAAKKIEVDEGSGVFEHSFEGREELTISWEEATETLPVTPIPLWMSIIPPLVAIFMALMIREVFSSLFLGILIGAAVISFYQGHNLLIAVFKGLFLTIDTYIMDALLQEDHMSVILFSMIIGATVSLVTRNGGMKGVVNYLSRFASKPRSGQFITWLMGIMIFFDDYANTLVVGNTMRPITDRLRISRQKLAYIVDSTAAPVAAIAFVTTWIGAELSYIEDGVKLLGLNQSSYSIFLNSLLYSFYPIFALALIIILIIRNVDYGPMLAAERRARVHGVNPVHLSATGGAEKFEAIKGVEGRWYNAVVPIFVIVTGTFAGLLYTGYDATVWSDDSLSFTTKVSATLGESNSYKSLLWASLGGMLVAVAMTIIQRIMSLKESIEGLMAGFRTMLTAVFILTLAWALALVTQHMHTAEFISGTMLKVSLSPYILPALTFILAALVAFSTGSSWSTMAILYPLLLPASWMLAQESGLDYGASMAIFYNVVSCILAGSVLGDHCSPISDTTILSSLASSCNHIEHVRTQLPYAISAGSVAVLIGTLPAAYGVHPLWLFPAGIIVLVLITFVFGRRTSPAKTEP
jgi:Na+/H+ antiporter NhaC